MGNGLNGAVQDHCMLLLPTCCRNACHMPTSTGATLWRTIKHTAYDAHSTLRQTQQQKQKTSSYRTAQAEKAAASGLLARVVELCILCECALCAMC
jgi:hypothetical protein